jgi:hypothetical protein
MGVTIEELQPLIDKDAIVHIIQPDGSIQEVEGRIKAATIAGVPFKPKGKSGVGLLTVDQIEEASLAPVKPKSVLQKKLKPIADGQMRQHLADRHGISLKWCREATEEQAVEYHNTLDHADLGHKHVEPKADDERQEALAEDESDED